MANPITQIIISARDEASSVFGAIRRNAGVLATAITGYFSGKLFGDAVTAASDFESAMSRVRAAAGASGEELSALRNAAETAGATTQYSSVQAAEALENLAKAGLSANEAVQALPAVLNLASAGGVELGEASEYITKAVAGMGMSFAEAGRVADVLAMGANASNTSVTGLAQALSYSAPLANSLGLSLEQTVAIIGKFADAGIDASRAGTALNSILAQFSDPASKFRKALADAGITTTDFDQALRQLAASGPAGQQAILAVGQEAGPALRALLNQGIGSLDALKAKLDDSAGSASTFAQVMNDNLDGATKGLGSAWDALLIKFGTPLLEPIKEQVNALAGRLQAFVADGTATRFGESIAAAFRAGAQWVQGFLDKVDFAAVGASLQGFANQAKALFEDVGAKATNAGNVFQTVTGVMSAGWNSVLTVIYTVGQGVSKFVQATLEGLAVVADGFDKITPDAVTERFRLAAEGMRAEAAAAGAVAEEFGRKSSAAFDAATEGAVAAQAGWQSLNTATAAAATETEKSSAALQIAAEQSGITADELDALGESAEVSGGKVVQVKQAAEAAAPSIKAMGTAAQGAAEDVEAAFQRLGVTSSASLRQAAENAERDFNTIRLSGRATADDIRNAFTSYAEKAIAANGGVATATLRAQAAQQGLRIETDSTGNTIVTRMGEAASAVESVGEAAVRAGRQVQQLGQQVQSVADEREALFKKWDGEVEQARQGGGSAGSTFYRMARNKGLAGDLTADEVARFNELAAHSYEKNRGGLGGPRTIGSLDQWIDYIDRRNNRAIGDALNQIMEERKKEQSGGGGTKNYNVTIRLPGKAGRTVSMASDEDAQTLTRILRELEDAAGVSQ